LYISKGIVEAHGGKIWAENNTDGKGASFSFSLPLDKSNIKVDKIDASAYCFK
jgi:signal transduction histidine kinase